MTLRHFQIFVTVQDTGGMTRAAERLHMTQPSVSQAIRELEAHYGVLLFERLGKKLFLTQAGEELLKYVRPLLHLEVQTESAMRSFGDRYYLRMGASITIGENLLIELLVRLREKFNQKIFSEIHNTEELETMLLKDALDIAWVEGSIQSEYLVERPVMEDELIFVAAPEYPLPVMKSIQDLGRIPFFVREAGSGTRRLFAEKMREKQVFVNLAGVYNNAESIKQAVRAGFGATVISARSVNRDLQQGLLRQFFVPEVSLKRTFRLIYHRNKYLSPEIQQVLHLCQAFGRELSLREGGFS